MSYDHTESGVLHMIFGPMFSGKSTEGIKRIRKYAVVYGDELTLSVKYSGDNRYTEDAKVSTHDRTTLPAISCTKLEELGEEWKKYRVIFIDEGQFFEDIKQFVLHALKNQIIIIVAGLDGDYKKDPFPNDWLSLIPYASHVKKLKAICKCGNAAAFTTRMSSETEQTVIGGSDKYEARCNKCWK